MPLRRRVSVGSESIFRRSGLLHVEAFESTLAENHVHLADSRSLLDWGAGCGRMTTHLVSRAASTRVTAADTDAEAITWVGENLDVATFAVLPLETPSSLANDSFDLVIGHSVFSHLDARTQDLWLAELTRITQAGGHIAVSFNGPVCLAWHAEHPLVALPTSIEEDLHSKGIAIWTGDGWESEFYDGYHTTFHHHDYIREHWSRFADVVDIRQAAALPTQDIAILRVG